MHRHNMLGQRIRIAILATALPAGPALAAQLEEVVVTAQRRAENLQDVPVAITALGQDSIEKADIRDLTDIATRVPGLSFSPFSPGQNILSLRGASSNDDGAGTDNSIAVFIDDVYLGRVSNVNPEMFDIERIEVLRGPQGTLYGKNTIGGAINVVSTRPNTEQLEGKVRVSLGNYDRRDIAGLLTGPIAERWAAKGSFSLRKRDGWVDNVFLGKKQKDDDSQAYRGQLLYHGDRFEAMFSADYDRLDVEDMARVPIATGEPGDPAFWAADVPGSYAELCAGRGPSCSANPVDGYAKREAGGVSARLSWELDAGELISITAYRESEADWSMDSTGTPASPLPGAIFGFVDDRILDKTDQLSQELRWVSSIGSNMDYVTGLWLMREETDRTECFDNDGDDSDCVPDADGGLTDWYRQENETTSYAVFGQADWRPSEAWSLTLGGRYSYEKKSIDNDTIAGDFVVINQTFSNSVSESWSAFTPKAAIAFDINDTSRVYASIAKGFKSGGFAAAPQGIEFTEPLDQEEALGYEIGFKGDFAGRLRFNAALFYTEYEGLQIQTFGPLTPGSDFGTFQTFNAGDAEVRGIELESTWRVTQALTLSGFYAYQDSEFKSTDIPGTAFPDQRGQDLPRTPGEKYSLSLDYDHPLADGSAVNLNLSYRYTDDQRGELEPWAIQPSFELIDARLGWTNRSERLELALWGKNLADEEYISHVYTIASSVVAVFGEPRTYGVAATYRF